jgi:hypothetical protein
MNDNFHSWGVLLGCTKAADLKSIDFLVTRLLRRGVMRVMLGWEGDVCDRQIGVCTGPLYHAMVVNFGG